MTSREEVRGILNRNPSKLGKQLKKAMDEVGEGGIWNGIKQGNLDELAKIAERGIKTKIDQQIQLEQTGAKSIDLSSVLVIRIGKRILKWKHIGKKNNWKEHLKRRGRD